MRYVIGMALITIGLATASGAEQSPRPVTGSRALIDAEAEYHSGLEAASGSNGVKDYAAAATHYRTAAEKGHIGAQYSLAYLYENGLGVARDFKQAAVWYRKAAEQGDPDSQTNLGTLYATGDGVPRSDIEAAHWFRLAADQGDLEGMNNLGAMYLQGRGVARDPLRAFQLCRKAAENGYADAENNIALMYANGQGVNKDVVWAWAWFDLASEKIPAAAGLRDRMARGMTPSQIELARKRATAKKSQRGSK